MSIRTSKAEVADERGRRIYNPVQKDYATFIETAAETGGTRTLVEIELAPGGGNPLHIHRAFTERFTVVEGELAVQVGKQRHVLRTGESVAALPSVPHGFWGVANQPARFLVEITPGHTGFETALRIAYGLAIDGRTTAGGVPRNLKELAILIDMSDTAPAGAAAVLMPAFRWLARRARAEGVEQALLQRYCPEHTEASVW